MVGFVDRQKFHLEHKLTTKTGWSSVLISSYPLTYVGSNGNPRNHRFQCFCRSIHDLDDLGVPPIGNFHIRW